MDANERLQFINRLNSLTGDQAREALKQMAINCNTKQTTIARALRNAVDQHAPVQYFAPVALQPMPSVTTSTTTSQPQEKTSGHEEGTMSDTREDCAQEATPASMVQKKHEARRGNNHPDRNTGRKIFNKSRPERKSAQVEDKTDGGNRRGALPSRDIKKDNASLATDRGNKLNINRGRINEEPVMVIDSDSSTSDSDTSDSETSDDETSESGDPVNARAVHDNVGKPISIKYEPSSDDSDSESSTDTTDTDSSDSDSSDSEQPVYMKPEHRRVLQRRGRSIQTAPAQASQPVPLSSVSKTTAEKPRQGAISAPADSTKKRKGLADASSLVVSRKRKAEEHDVVGHTNTADNVQESKKSKITECERSVEDRTCRNCLEVFPSRSHLFRHLHSLKHFDFSPKKSLSTPEKQPTGLRVDMEIKAELDEQVDSPSTSIRRAKPARDTPKAMAPPPFIKAPNNFPRGPTPAPMALARRKSSGDAGPEMAKSGVHTPPPLPQASGSEVVPFKPQGAAQTADVRELKCRFCHEYFKRSDNHATACRRHDGHTIRLPDEELARIGEQHEVPRSKRKWSGCGHWVYNEPPNDGCMPTPHFWDKVAWRDADGIDGTKVELS